MYRPSAHPSRLFASSVPLLGLAALSLAAAPVHAQTTSLTLNDGDNVTVSGAGTAGTVNSSATSYNDSDNSGYAVQANGTASFALGTGGSLTSGASSITLDSEGSGPISVSGGTVTGGDNSYGIYTGYGSPVSVSGGTITAGNNSLGVYADGGGPVSVSGGTLTVGDSSTGVYYDGSGPVTVSGGTITAGQNGNGIYDAGTGLVTISGGESIGGVYGFGLFAATGSTVLVSGGTISGGGPLVDHGFGAFRGPGQGVIADGGTVTITGGDITGGNGELGLSALSSGVINLFSQGDSNFFLNGVAINNTSLTADESGTITGILSDGTALDTRFADGTGATFNFNVGTPPASAAPEPSAVAVWALAGLGGAGLVWKARRKTVAA